jgi:transcriptional regulator with XRE-family HTH domain
MVEKSQRGERSGVRTQRLWVHIGLRLRSRRLQMGFTEGSIAAHLGIALSAYQDFEAGRAEMPAAQLADLAELFKVSMFYFFQEAAFGDVEPAPPSSPEPPRIFTVATDEDRAASLIHDFRSLDRNRQQYLLLLARALAAQSQDE